MAENSLLGKLDGLVSRFEEVGTLLIASVAAFAVVSPDAVKE